MPMGFIYLLHSNDRYKIGFTRKSIKNRIKQLQTGSSDEIYLISSFESEYYTKIESALHRKFNSNKILNEWFELPDDIVINFKKICKKLHNTFKLLEENNTYLQEKMVTLSDSGESNPT